MKRLHFSMLVLAALVVVTGGRVLAQGWSTLGPASRFETTMAYDAGTDSAIVFGGQAANSVLLNDVFTATNLTANSGAKALDLTWVQNFPTGAAPAPRFGHTAVYSASNNRLLIFGGATAVSPVCSSEFWVLNGANGTAAHESWSKITPSGTAPSARMAHTAVYAIANDIMIVFGGYDCAGHYLADVWVLTNASGALGSPVWTQLNVSGSGPSARQFATAVYDPGSNRMMIYGGDSGGSPWGDAWYLTNANGRGGTASWTQLTPTGTAPTARTGHVSYYDAVNNRMMISDGYSGTAALGDTYILVNANGNGTPSWSMLNAGVVGILPTRHNHVILYISAINTAMTFAGINGTTASSSTIDDHVFVLSVANGLP